MILKNFILIRKIWICYSSHDMDNF